MNKFKNILSIIAVSAILFSISSCGDGFLKEERFWQESTQWFETPDGVRALALGLPNVLRLPYAHEFGYAINNYGTDEFQVGGDGANRPWNDYNAVLQPSMTGTNLATPRDPWDHMWIHINNCNTVIRNINNGVMDGESDKNEYYGVAHFIRAWCYLYFVQMWGDVPLKLNPSEELEREFPRVAKEIVLQQLIDDFEIAYNNLPRMSYASSGARVGWVYKDAAAHYLAKALLYRTSEINDSFNGPTKTQDLSKALQLCDEVIANRQLAPNYADLWDYKEYDGPNERLDEILVSAQWSRYGQDSGGRFNGNRSTNYFLSQYLNWLGMTRATSGGREYQRLKTTEYSYDVYDRVNDSRFWKSFRTTLRVNTPTKVGGFVTTLTMGQTGVMHIVNSPQDASRFKLIPTLGADQQPLGHIPTGASNPPQILMNDGTGNFVPIKCPETGNLVPSVLPRHRVIEGFPSISTNAFTQASVFTSLNKYHDGLRTNAASEVGTRDGFNARLGETYLIAAEIKVRQGEYAAAFNYINPLRLRAAYKSGEDRGHYVDGSQGYVPTGTEPATTFLDKNTYYISNNIPETERSATSLAVTSIANLPAEDMAIINKLGLTSDYDKMLCFVLNERSRELMGEMHRWTDLARTKTLIARVKNYNEDAILEVGKGGGIKEHHYLRPIPQSYIDEIYISGRPLTTEEKVAMQNPGYN